MKTILVLIASSPFSTGNCLSGLHYCEAALDAGHRVKVFFYGDGVLNGNAFVSPSSDELNLCQRWQSLAENTNMELIVCNTAANRRGVLSEDEAPEQFNLASPFVIGGLSEFAALTQSVDRMVQF